MNFTCYDMSGQGKYWGLWEENYATVQGVIFVVDSADKLRVAVAKNELDMMLSHINIKSRAVPILFFANKWDLPHAMSDVEVCWELELD